MTRQTSASSASAPRRDLIRRLFVSGFALVLLAGVAIQFVPYGRNHTNPPVSGDPAWNSAQTRLVFQRACADCHSNQTVWPWYSNVAPMSWLVARDVQKGRNKFNISEWDRSDKHGDEAAKEVRKGSMPPSQYLLAHPSARLSAEERQAFIDGLIATFGDQRDGDSEGDDD
jgi:hypothetical protein